MSEAIITVENLGKKYQIKHQVERQRYNTLRDVVAGKIKGLFRSSNSKLPTSNSVEDFWALKDVSFEIKQGEVVGIIGRNGAGKSTLLKILSRITEPTEGRVHIKGRVASLLEVGTGFHPELTGRENIFLNGAILGMTRIEIKEKFDEIVAFAEVEKFLDTPVKRYSSGMYVRLAFAVAAHLEPEILIVDEVLAVGDADFQKKCLGKMQEVAMGGRTVLFVSHNMASIMNLCSRGIWLNRGKFEMSGDPKTVINKYLERSVTRVDEPIERPAWATPLVQKVEVLDQSGQGRNAFTLGQPVTIQISFRTPSSTPLKQPVMGVIIHHATRGVVGGVNTRMTGFSTPSETSFMGRFRCTFTKLPLLPGRYSVDIWLGDGPADLDTLVSACQFDIEEGDVYGTGKVPFAELGLIYLDPQWEFNSDHVEKVPAQD